MGYAQELERRLSRFSNFAVSFSIICILSGGINSLRAGDLGRRRHRNWHRMARRLLRVADLRCRHVTDQLGLSDGRRPLPLGLDPRQPRHRLGDGMAQPAWPDHRSRRHQCRHMDTSSWAPSARPLGDRDNLTNQNDLPDHHHRRPGAHQSSRHQADGQAHRLLRLAHFRRIPILIAVVCPPRGGRQLGLQPAVHLHQLFRRSRRQRPWPAVSNWWVFALGLLLPIYTITGYDASAHTSEETIKAARSVPRAMVIVGCLVGDLLGSPCSWRPSS